MAGGHIYLAIYSVGSERDKSFQFARGVFPGPPDTVIPGTLTLATSGSDANHTSTTVIDLMTVSSITLAVLNAQSSAAIVNGARCQVTIVTLR